MRDLRGGTTQRIVRGGMVQPGNIDLAHRPVVHNPDGTISTVRSISISVGPYVYLIPTVVGHRVVSNMEAIRHFQQTGQHLGIFTSERAAESYAVRLHNAQAREYAGR